MRSGTDGYAHRMSTGLPNLVVIGAMKCATTALHKYLDAHPDVSMSAAKETNFFTGPDERPNDDPTTWWRFGQWHRGLSWYTSQFDQESPVRGETSPGYTSPDHAVAAQRMALVIPDARLVYVVRDPVERAASQYDHHVREGAESRLPEQALLDPDSQYLARSRYFDRIRPFLERFSHAQIHIVVQERLLLDRRRELRRVYRHVGADDRWWDADLERRWHVGRRITRPSPRLRAAVQEAVADDTERLRSYLGDPLPEWRVQFEGGALGHVR